MSTEGGGAHIVLIRVVSLLEGEDGGVGDAAVLFHGVCPRGEGQDGLVVGRKTRESQLGKVVDEEIELGGHTAQTGLYQPGEKRERERMKTGVRQQQQTDLPLTQCCYSAINSQTNPVWPVLQ